MCQHISSFDTKTKFVILMHPKEFKKVKNNTGFLTNESLQNAELFIGIDFSNHTRINQIIQTHQSYILFPSEDALNLSTANKHELKQGNEQLAIFLIDSTWACAKSIFFKSKNLQKLQHMSFSTDRVSQYDIKEQPESHYLSTIESTHLVLELLNEKEIERVDDEKLDKFLNPFLKMIEYQKELIANPRSHAVRFRRKRVK